jgi:hypothetical protein
LKIGRADRWWNRNVPIGRISAVVILGVTALYAWLIYGDLFSDYAWGIQHHRIASCGDVRVKLPFMWRQDDWPQNSVENAFSRHHRGLAELSLESIDIHEYPAKPESFDTTFARMKQMAQMLSMQSSGQGSVVEDYREDTEVATKFSCLEIRKTALPGLTLWCLSHDGRWSVNLLGTTKSLEDLNSVLRQLPTATVPTF